MSTPVERQLARLRARFEERAGELAHTGFLLKGSLLQTRRRCSSAGCACQTDPTRLHGPYWQWTSRVKGRTMTRAVSEAQLSRYREWMENADRFEEVVQELYDLSLQANELLRTREDPSPERKKPASRHRIRARSSS